MNDGNDKIFSSSISEIGRTHFPSLHAQIWRLLLLSLDTYVTQKTSSKEKWWFNCRCNNIALALVSHNIALKWWVIRSEQNQWQIRLKGRIKLGTEEKWEDLKACEKNFLVVSNLSDFNNSMIRPKTEKDRIFYLNFFYSAKEGFIS